MGDSRRRRVGRAAGWMHPEYTAAMRTRFTRTSLPGLFRASAAAALLLAGSLVWAQPQSPGDTADPAPGSAADAGTAAQPDGAPLERRLAPRPEPSPALQCYRAAQRAIAGRRPDAYVCDLAVQMARDGVSPEASAAALANRALVLAADDRLEPALGDLQAALTLNPAAPARHALYGNLGNLLLRLGSPADALAAHDQAVALAPDDPGSYFNRAFSYRALGDPARAEQDVRAARSLLERRALPLSDARTGVADVDRSR